MIILSYYTHTLPKKGTDEVYYNIINHIYICENI